LEMNTRLQVEHPVTETVTGVDIVKEQIRIARGRKLRYSQEDIRLNGWAIECRINAEDPFNNFIPSTGRISMLRRPAGPGVRIDSGVDTGSEITPYYDSLLSKLIVWGETRGEAIVRTRRALREYRVLGIKTNIPFHQAIMESHRFHGGQFDTTFVEQRFSIDENIPEDLPRVAAIAATLVEHQRGQQAAQMVRGPSRDVSNWKLAGRSERMKK